jgi:hypothetical protein
MRDVSVGETEKTAPGIFRIILRLEYLEGAWVGHSDLRGTDLLGAHLERATLLEARLQEAYLWRAHLEEAKLWDAHLNGAQLADAHLEGAHLEGAHLDGAYLHGAVLSCETGCDEADWGVCGEEREGVWRQAEAVYRAIGRHYAEVGNYERCDEFYFREMRMRHRELVGDRPVGGDGGDAHRAPVVVDWTKGLWRGVVESARQWWRHFREEIVARACPGPPPSGLAATGLPALHRLLRLGLAMPVVAVSLAGKALAARVVRPAPVFGLIPRAIWAAHRLVWGYGVRPARAFVWMAAVVILCAFAFRFHLPVENAHSQIVLPAPGWLAWKAWRLALTVALDAFTTVGYGAYRPATAGGQLAAGLAGLAGVILAAAFIVALGAKYIRRGL